MDKLTKALQRLSTELFRLKIYCIFAHCIATTMHWPNTALIHRHTHSSGRHYHHRVQLDLKQTEVVRFRSWFIYWIVGRFRVYQRVIGPDSNTVLSVLLDSFQVCLCLIGPVICSAPDLIISFLVFQYVISSVQVVGPFFCTYGFLFLYCI